MTTCADIAIVGILCCLVLYAALGFYILQMKQIYRDIQLALSVRNGDAWQLPTLPRTAYLRTWSFNRFVRELRS